MYVTPERVDTAYAKLTAHMSTYHLGSEILANVKAELEGLRMEAIAEGSLTGKNAEEREAAARKRWPELYKALESAEKNAVKFRLDLDLAKVEVERLRLLVRLDELTARGDNGTHSF